MNTQPLSSCSSCGWWETGSTKTRLGHAFVFRSDCQATGASDIVMNFIDWLSLSSCCSTKLCITAWVDGPSADWRARTLQEGAYAMIRCV